MKREVILPAFPLRIISLVPSQTELLYYLGLEKEVVGITKFCIHPDEWYRIKDRVGGTKSLDIEKIRQLKPDLIIGSKEENEQSDIKALMEIAPVWMSDIFNLDDAIQMIHSVGQISNKAVESNELVKRIQEQFELLNSLKEDKTVLYFIWQEPMMLAGKNTFIDSMLQQCGLTNLAGNERYPEATGKENPDFIFLSSEPFPFGEKHISEFQQLYPKSKVVLVDGEFFSWYGSKLKDAPNYFNQILTQL
ncbi:MAG: helical backbone metal receptor [Crocinitomicaceae bacterium]|jgi:ABC-type Fe3+-hydroxamate transport system substrate-binding protein|nr:helical backbone metal receptor [Crocinitomicaceae bacterium]